MQQRGLALAVKRVMDVAIAGAALVAVAPIMAVAAAAIAVEDGTPVLFRQTRPGRGGKPFELTKFRTMKVSKSDDPRFDGERMTRVGKFLRDASVDELPQLFNVLRGDMSLVGPRPLLMRYLPRYTKEQMRRHEVLPGITGLAAVSGRNALSWDEKFALDLEYVERWSPWLDVQIVAKTLVRVLERSNVAAEGHATSPEFFGNRADLN